MKSIQWHIFSLFLFLPINMAFSMDYYVSAKGSGLKNGSSIQDSWAGFSNIQWGTQNGQVGPGSNLYICGEIESKLVVGISGKSGNPVVIRGDCPGNPGIIDGANIVNGTWTLVSNNIYSIPLSTHVRGIVTEDDSALVEVPWKTDAATTITAMLAYGNGTWSYDPANQILYVLTSVTDNPSGHIIEASYGQNYTTQVYLHNLSFVTLENLTVKNFGDYGIDISSTGSNDIINNCTIYNGYNWGVFSQGITNMVTSNNTIHHMVWAGHLPNQSQAIGEVIRYFGNTSGSIYGNNISYSPSIGVDLIAHSTGVKVYGNTIHDNAGLTNMWAGGIYMDNAQNNYIYGNLIYNYQMGMSISSETPGASSSGNYVYNNVVYNSHLAGFILGATGAKYTSSSGNYVYNNTIVMSNGATFMIGASSNDTVKNNIIWGSLGWITSNYQTLGGFDYNQYFCNFNVNFGTLQNFAQWQTVSGDVHSTNTSRYIPEILTTTFINPKGLNFELNAGSKLIGSATNLSSIFTTDFKGATRPATGAWDAGAYETR